jgi:hypothetical protein
MSNITSCSTNDKVGPFEDAGTVLKKAQRGDLIEFQRTGYAHWGMFIGLERVIHLCNSGNGKGEVLRELLVEVAKDDKCRINNKEKMVKKWSSHPDFIERDSDAAVEEAVKMLKEETKYDMIKENCEHLCTKWKYGVSNSAQVNFRKPNIVSLSWYHTYVSELEGCAFLKIVLHIK